MKNPYARLGVALVCVVVPIFVGYAVVGHLGLDPATMLNVTMIVELLVAVATYAFFVRRIERRRLVEFERAPAARELAIGLAIGAGLFCATVLVLWGLGVFTLTGTGELAWIVGPTILAIGSGVAEEIVFRGVIFRLLEEGLGSWIAIAISAVLFGAAHVLSPNPTVLACVAIMFEAGILLSAAYMLTRRLWMPIGIHAAWNFTQGGVFGLAISGHPSRGLLMGTLNGPEWLAGGAFGAEASLVAVVLCVSAAAVLVALAIRRGNVVAPSWRRATASAGVPAAGA